MFSEHGHDYSLMSWWPTDTVWQTNEQHTRWTEKADMSKGLKRFDKDKQGLLTVIDGELKSAVQANCDASTTLLPMHSIGSSIAM